MTIALRKWLMIPAGIVMLALAWTKNRLRGYRTPNTVAEADIDGRIDYVYDTVQSWERFLPPHFSFMGLDVLEMSPGSSLGTGAILIASGAKSYHAIDAFKLAGDEDSNFFKTVLDRFPDKDAHRTDIARTLSVIDAKETRYFDYKIRDDFDIERLSDGKTFDVILSCAAFEHYDDIVRTIGQLSKVARKGCIAAHIIDFQTHSRWIREFDPNNIYRFSEKLYRLFAFRGQPNRCRPVDYVKAFEANGWKNVRVVPARNIAPNLLKSLLQGMAPPFDRTEMQMDMLSGVLIAEKD